MRLPEGFNIHHPDYKRREYNRNPTLRTLRQLGAITTQIEAHDELHANVPPIPKMSLDLARFSLDVIADSRTGMGRSQSGLTIFENRMLAYDALGRCRGGLATEARRFGEHFENQYQYLRGATL